MKSKTTKPSALKVFNDNKVTANKKADIAMKSFKKSLPKAQPGQSVGTPFQDYMKIPGALASDTIGKNIDNRSYIPPIPKNPKNKGALESAWKKTYGIDFKSDIGTPPAGESLEAYRRRMGPMKKGGSTKAKMAKGGVTKSTKFAALAPPYNKATAADRIAGAKKNKKK
jgi:hypothetical protein